MTLMVVLSCLLIGTALFQFSSIGASIVSSAHELRRQQRGRLASLRHRAEVVRLNSELQSGHANTLDWRVMEVAEIVQESVDCRSYYLVDPYGQSLPEFHPGQYLMVRPALAGAYQTTRCYSLSSAPNDQYWRITVKRQENNEQSWRRTKQGGLSKWLHDAIHVGDCLMVGGPNGQFFLSPDNSSPLVLLAAGIGITPAASMLRWSMQHTPDRPVTLIYQVQDTDHWPLGEVLHSWASGHPQIRLITYFSRLDERQVRSLRQKISGELRHGKYGFEDVVKHNTAQASDYYMCGPEAWMAALRQGLEQSGSPLERLNWESFGSQSGASDVTLETPEAAAEVRFAHSQVDTQWADPDQSIWELAQANGVEIPSGCLSGVCGCCRTRVLQGTVDHDREVVVDLADDECLACIARPSSDVVIDA